MADSSPQLVLLSTASTARTAATVAAANIQSRMTTAFNTMVQAWQSSRLTMWGISTDPQDIADAFGAYATDWFKLFDDLQTLLNDYMPAASVLPEFVHPNYVVTADVDSGANQTGTVTISGTLDASAA